MMKKGIGIFIFSTIIVSHLWGQAGSSCCNPINLMQEELTLHVDSGSLWFYTLSSLANYDVMFRPATWGTIADTTEIYDRRILFNFLVVCNCEDGPHYDSVYIHYWPEEEKEALMEKDNEVIASYNMYIMPLRTVDSISLDSLSNVEISELNAEDVFYQIQNFGIEERKQADLGGMLNEASGFIEMVFPMAGSLTLINRSENITCQQNTIFLNYNDTAKAVAGQLYRMCPVRDITMDGINIVYSGNTDADVYMYRNCKRELFEIEGLKHNVTDDGYWLTLQPNNGVETFIDLHDFIMIYEQYRQFFFEVISTDKNAYVQVVNYKTPPTESISTFEIQHSSVPSKYLRNGHIIICMPDGSEYDPFGRRIK